MQLAHVSEIPPVRREGDDMLSILIDARKVKHGGIGVYLKNLIAGLSAFNDIEVTALVAPDGKETVLELGASKAIAISTKLYSYDELFRFHKLIDFTQFDLFHSPHFTLPYRIPIPTVVTIHDTIHISNPERWYYPFLIKRFIRSALKRADKVLTVSEASRRNLEALYSKLKNPIAVIPNAVDPIFMIGEGDSTVESLDDFDSDQIIERENYCLAVLSNQKPHKGLPDLLKAFSDLKNTVKDGTYENALVEKVTHLKLILVGQGVESIKGTTQFGDDVEVKGRVSVSDLRALYKRAQCLIVPSKAEGFCLPVIEAQSCGTPVITRPVPAILELMTTNDIVAANFEAQSLARAILEFFVKRVSRTELVDYGVPLAHMQRFDRKVVCEQVLKTYRSLVPLKTRSDRISV